MFETFNLISHIYIYKTFYIYSLALILLDIVSSTLYVTSEILSILKIQILCSNVELNFFDTR